MWRDASTLRYDIQLRATAIKEERVFGAKTCPQVGQTQDTRLRLVDIVRQSIEVKGQAEHGFVGRIDKWTMPSVSRLQAEVLAEATILATAPLHSPRNTRCDVAG
ncbi:MAG: hypothetical protein DWQ31_08610 [Planctomycetota bacterium]|nr:MAG: hypothetical protein DWQ31_08610 [Planctomycetota bacterium]REJ86945.1 MAG: hypothetical protein DWQ35_22560 [Planctomycetota bacterium]REK24928.1 MAG: hypothetical protein DWQ42_12610 [Planctomycetota bacterium]REK48517.1 MAG: hypothetical protein DWQ46_02140 [Planctomycetota bacterium]